MPAKSKAQQRLFGIARAVQKGERSASSVSDPAKMIAKKVKKREVDKFASTPSKNLPDRVKKEIKGAIAELVTELLNETPESKKYLFNKKLAAAREKKYVYGTRDNKWHLVGPEDRDYGTAISQADFKKLGPERAKAQYLAPSRIKEAPSSGSITVQCQECGKKFKTKSMIPTCPKCGGSDVDLANESAQPSQLAKLQEKLGRTLSVPEKHSLAIAYKTMKMPDAMVGVMGGMTKNQAKAEIERLTGKKYEPRESVEETSKKEIKVGSRVRVSGGPRWRQDGRVTKVYPAGQLYPGEEAFIVKFPGEKEEKRYRRGDLALNEHHNSEFPPEVLNMTVNALLDKLEKTNPQLYATVEQELEKDVPRNEAAEIPKKRCKYCGKMRPSYLIGSHEKSCEKNPKKESVNEYEGPHPSDAANYWIECPKCKYKTGINSGEFDSPPPHDKILCPKCKTPMKPKDLQYAKKYGWKESVTEADKEKFQCPKCGKSMTPDPKTGLHKCSCGWKETEPKGEGFKIDKGVPVKEQNEFKPEYSWLNKLEKKKSYHVGPVGIMMFFDSSKKVLAVLAGYHINPTHKAEDAPRHIEAALDGITGLKDTVFKLDQIAPHKEKRTTYWISKVWLLPISKVSKLNNKKENVHEYLDESEASDQAKKMGLDYMQFGRWGKKGKVTHQTQNGKLVPVQGEEKPTQPAQKTKPQWVDEPSFKTSTPNTRFSGDSDKWFDDVSEWAIDPMKRGVENDALRVLQKLSRSAPTPKTIKSIYDITSKINRPHLKRVASQAAKILKNAYRKEFGRQFGGGGGKVSQASEFLSHLKQALEYND